MKHGTLVMICRVLIMSMMIFSFQAARAGMIGTEQVTAASGVSAERAAVIGMIDRSDVSRQLQSMGIEPQTAKDRVAAMTDQEVRALSGQFDSLPAGGISNWWIGAIVVAIILAVAFGWWQSSPKR